MAPFRVTSSSWILTLMRSRSVYAFFTLMRFRYQVSFMANSWSDTPLGAMLRRTALYCPVSSVLTILHTVFIRSTSQSWMLSISQNYSRLPAWFCNSVLLSEWQLVKVELLQGFFWHKISDTKEMGQTGRVYRWIREEKAVCLWVWSKLCIGVV